MNTNNIDKLFSDKLRDLERTPSSQAWQTLNKQLEQKKTKKKGVAWYSYAAAAALVLVVVSVSIILNSTKTPSSDVAITTPKIPMPEKEAGLIKETPIKTPATDLPAIEPAIKPLEKENLAAKKRSVKNPDNQLATIKKAPDKKASSAPAFTKGPSVSMETIAKIEVPTPAIDETVSQNQDLVEKLEQKKSTPETTLVVVVPLPEETPETEADVNEVNAKHQSKAGKLLGTLKKLKKGEFSELGINKENILALVKDRDKTK